MNVDEPDKDIRQEDEGTLSNKRKRIVGVADSTESNAEMCCGDIPQPLLSHESASVWRASALARTKLSDFLEAHVKHLLSAQGTRCYQCAK
jgi:hypothetical protein